MSLVNSYVELNRVADEMIATIKNINERYFNEDIEYPNNEISMFLNKYDVMFKRVIRKRNSIVNKILNKINKKRQKQLDGMKILDRYEVHNKASVESISLILDTFEQNKLTEDSRVEVKEKLFPVVNGFSLYYLVELYPKCKKCERIQRSANGLAYLQEMFVEFIIANILHDNMRKGLKSGVVWSYQEICNNILDEKPYKIISINKDK